MINLIMIGKLSSKSKGYHRYLLDSIINTLENKVHITYYTSRKANVNNNYVKNLWTPLLYPFQILREIIKDQSHIIHLQFEVNTFGPLFTIIYLPLLLLLLKFTNRIIIITIHAVIPFDVTLNDFYGFSGFQSQLFHKLFKMFLIFIYKILNIASNMVIVHTKSNKENLISYYGFNPDKISVVPHGILNSYKRPSCKKFKKWKKITRDKKVILFFGSISRRKGVEYLIDAFKNISKKYSDYLLIIAGWVTDKIYAKQISEFSRNNTSILIFRSVDDEDVYVLFNLSDFVIFPYRLSFGASGPLALAYFHEIPIIATRIGVFSEDLEGFNDSFLALPCNSNLLASTIELMMQQNNNQHEFKSRIVQIKKERSWGNIAKIHYKIYLKMLKRVKTKQKYVE